MAVAKKTDVQGFIKKSGVETILADLKKEIATQELQGKKFIVSDVYDKDNHQYVDLVQEGGGVWGVALLGFTYVLEKMGIRFFSLAGTSAGAINTILLAATNNKQDEKTEMIIEQFLELDLFSFVDGKKGDSSLTSWIKNTIQKFILRKNYLQKLKTSILLFTGAIAALTIATFITGIFVHNSLVKWVAIGALLLWIIAAVILLVLDNRIKHIAKTGYGLNKGDAFHEWISKCLAKNGIKTLEDLRTRFSGVPQGLLVRTDKNRDTDTAGTVTPPNSPMLTIITSDISTGNKIEFPRMWELYWSDKARVNPADFVRASMSIPVFFETYTIKVSKDIYKPEDKWKDHLNWTGKIPHEVRFVDGGALSNFPINVFYNPKYIIPRMPTFGIRLGDAKGQTPNKLKTIFEYIGAIISTLRGSTDKDFINKNKAFTLAVKEVDLKGHSWLNFFMKEEEKEVIFRKGAEAAATFLKDFNWENYKQQRFENNKVLEDQRDNPNNW